MHTTRFNVKTSAFCRAVYFYILYDSRFRPTHVLFHHLQHVRFCNGGVVVICAKTITYTS